jgi:Flp pilus assembly protein TadG
MNLSISLMSLPRNLWRRLVRDRAGITTIEFAIAVPIFTAVVVGLVQGGFLLFDEIELANAVGVGSRTFAVARQPSCLRCAAEPYTSTVNAVVDSSRLRLAAANVTIAVGGRPCTNDETCLAALKAAHFSSAYYSPAAQASVTVTYPCPKLLPSTLFEFIGACPTGSLSLEMTQQVQ